GPAGIRMAGVLRALFSRGRNRFDILCRAGGERCPALGRANACFVSVQLQTAARDHARLQTARLHERADRVFARDRTARIQASSRADSIAALVHAERWPTDVAKISDATSERFSVRGRISSSPLASAANHSFA